MKTPTFFRLAPCTVPSEKKHCVKTFSVQGDSADEETKQAGLKLAGDIEAELEGNVTIVKIPQGKETKHFLSIFKGMELINDVSKSVRFIIVFLPMILSIY